MPDRVFRRLGFDRPPEPNLAGLRTLYRAWCHNVPFDNVRKMTALLANAPGPLPGIDAADFFDHWLEHGAGGTCWPSSNALFELFCAAGFDARRAGGHMADLPEVNHGTVVVHLDGRRWLVDSSMLTNVPLPLDATPFAHSDPLIAACVEPAGAGHMLRVEFPPHTEPLLCRLSSTPIDRAFCLAAYESTRAQSIFNGRLYARRNRAGAVVVIVGNTLNRKTAAGLDHRELSGPEIPRALQHEIGISAELVDEWVRCGGLAASCGPSA